MTARRKRPASAQERLEARTVTVHVSVGHGASVEAEGVPLADVGPLIAYAVELRRALIERGYDELIPSDVTTVPADRVEVPEELADDEARVRPSDAARPRVGFAPP